MDGTIKPSQLSVESASKEADGDFDFMKEFLSDAILPDPPANKHSTPSSSDNHESSDVDFSQIFWADYGPLDLLDAPLLTPGLTAVPTMMQTPSAQSFAPTNAPAASQVGSLSEQFQSDFTFSDVPLPMLTFEPQYHPAIGWYFPAAPQTSFLSTTSDAYPHAQTGAGPAESSTQMTQQPNKTEETAHDDVLVTKFQHTANEPLSSQANKRKSDDQTPKITKWKKKAEDTLDTIVKCTCKKDANHIPRPNNAFFIYRSAHCKDLINKHFNNRQVSKITAENWQKESEEVKAKYRALAHEEKKRHQQKYPNYKYNPRPKYLKDHQHTCALRKASEQASDEASTPSGFDADFEQDDFDSDTETDIVHVVRRSTRNKKRAIYTED